MEPGNNEEHCKKHYYCLQLSKFKPLDDENKDALVRKDDVCTYTSTDGIVQVVTADDLIIPDVEQGVRDVRISIFPAKCSSKGKVSPIVVDE